VTSMPIIGPIMRISISNGDKGNRGYIGSIIYYCGYKTELLSGGTRQTTHCETIER